MWREQTRWHDKQMVDKAGGAFGSDRYCINRVGVFPDLLKGHL